MVAAMRDLLSEMPQPKQLRDYQSEAIHRVRQSLAEGKTRTVLQLPTGAGKTLTAATMIRLALAKGKRVTFTVPMLTLIDQTVAAFEAEGIHEIGVIQANHARTDYAMPVQVASVQTMTRRVIPETDMLVVDECHVASKAITRFMEDNPGVPVIGLSATPWRRGMAKDWDGLVVGTTIADLIGRGFLCPFRVFAPAHPDLSGVKTTAGDYQQDQLSEVMQEGTLVADIVSTWMERGEGRPTLMFGASRAHAKRVQDEFEAAGVPAGYVDAFTDRVERERLRRMFEAGEIKVACSVRTLTTGVDWSVGCIIDAAPTKSEMLHVQKIGRGLRVNKHIADDCIILDHASNTARLGFVTDIHHDALDDGKRAVRAKAEPKEALPKECPKCTYMKPPKTKECPSCGFEAVPTGYVETADGELVEIAPEGAKPKQATKAEKQAFYSGLLGFASTRNRSQGWAAHTYRERFGVWPRGLSERAVTPSDEVRRYVRAKDIRWAKSQGRK